MVPTWPGFITATEIWKITISVTCPRVIPARTVYSAKISRTVKAIVGASIIMYPPMNCGKSCFNIYFFKTYLLKLRKTGEGGPRRIGPGRCLRDHFCSESGWFGLCPIDHTQVLHSGLSIPLAMLSFPLSSPADFHPSCKYLTLRTIWQRCTVDNSMYQYKNNSP